jgi:hypothetical protein
MDPIFPKEKNRCQILRINIAEQKAKRIVIRSIKNTKSFLSGTMGSIEEHEQRWPWFNESSQQTRWNLVLGPAEMARLAYSAWRHGVTTYKSFQVMLIFRGANWLWCGAPPNLFSSIICTTSAEFWRVVQIIELRRFGGAPNGYPFAALLIFSASC